MAGGNIKVVVRCRPFNGREIDRGAKCIVEMKDNQTVLMPPPDVVDRGGKGNKDHGQKVFAFDRSYWSFNKSDPEYAGQSNLFDDLGHPLLDNAFQGYNNCIFAYGQTGSGKSYSMMGYGKDVGIIPMICQNMFKRIGGMQQDSNLRCTVEVSYLEIYNERVRDLLNPANKGNLKVREHPSTGPYVEDLAKLVVGSFQEIEHLMDEGNKARTVAATNMNETSSRSHAVFTLMLTQKRFDPDTKMAMEKAAKISLVDLAGSERATSTGATGARLKEGAEINRSLSTLGRVIAALADLSQGKRKKGAGGQVPYRDSVLTWLLKDSLGGNSMTAMIAAISPADINYDETLSTLRYADSAKRIKNHAVINEDANARMIRELKEELGMLKSKFGGGVSVAGGVPHSAEEVFPEGTPLEKQIVSITQADGSVKKVSKAEIAEQLSQSEKILSELNQTWEEKMQKTEEIHKEREAALEELGISIEKGFVGLSTPKKMPHLVNLSDDPLLAECLVYNLKPGTMTVGTAENNNIRLEGFRILPKHCTFDNAPDGSVTIIPEEGAAVMVNGKRISEPRRLHSGHRLIFGDFHIFRFNHPSEAREERAERQQSLLRQSVTVSQLQAMSPSPSPRRGQDKSHSRAESEFGDSHPESLVQRDGDADWSFARREAASAILGQDQSKLHRLTDEELNALYEDVLRARAERVNGREGEDDIESISSYQIREKYMSTGTIDNFSLDTALTMPSTPRQSEVDEKLQRVCEELQNQLDKHKEEYQDRTQTAEGANLGVEEIRMEKARMEETLQHLKDEMQFQLEAQRREYERKIETLDPLKRPRQKKRLGEDEKERAKAVVKHWRGRRYVQMAESVLQHAATLKEGQIMSQALEENVVLQFTVVDAGHGLCSSYDMMLNGLSGEGDDPALDEGSKPCIGVRVIDYKHGVVHLWSIEKLYERVRRMRQMYQYLDQPDYAQHLSLDNPLTETYMPQYTLVGEVDVPLRPVFESRVQDFTLDVLSPYTSHDIGILKLALEPSSARAPSNTLKFNTVMHEMVGFAEREGTEVHAQLFVPGISEEAGITTTQMIKDFDEGPIRFESVHSMKVPVFAAPDTTLRVAIFAKVSAMYLDRLLSWDGMRDTVPVSQNNPKAARISESQFFIEEKHDLLARVQILEMNEEGEYVPVEVTQASELDSGTFQLHQGLQRRIAFNLTHSSGVSFAWDDIHSMRVGKIQLLDSAGKTPDMGTSGDEVTLRMSKPSFRTNANGTRVIAFTGQWDSSQHNSLLLNRVTPDKYRVQMAASWDISSKKLAEPMRFSMNLCTQVVSRTSVRQASYFSSILKQMRIVHSATGIFTLQMRPAPMKRVDDLWRMNSQHGYVKGEEKLGAWSPRGVSLIVDFVKAKKKKARLAEIAVVQDRLKRLRFANSSEPADLVNLEDGADIPPPRLDTDSDSIMELLKDTPDGTPSSSWKGSQAVEKVDVDDDTSATEPTVTADVESELSERDSALLGKCLALWQRYRDPTTKLLSTANTSPPVNSSPETPMEAGFVATVVRVSKNPKLLKGGYLLVPSSDWTRWLRRFVELRRPYMHVYNPADGEEIAIVSLRNARIDSHPEILGLLKGEDEGLKYKPSDIASDDGICNRTPSVVLNRIGSPAAGHPHKLTRSAGGIMSSLWPGSGPPAANGDGLKKLSERLQAGVFAVYGTDNTWLFAARSERDKVDWVARIDQSFVNGSGSGSANVSGTASPSVAEGEWR